MPVLTLTTSLSLNDLQQKQLSKSLSEICAKALGKPETTVMVIIQPDVMMMFGGQHKPCAFIDIKSIGGLTAEVNAQLSADLCQLLTSELPIVSNCIYLNFTDIERPKWGFDGKTF